MFRYLDLLLKILIQQHLIPSKCFILITDSSNFGLKTPPSVPVINVEINGNISQFADIIFHDFGCDNFILTVNEPSKAFSAIETELRAHSEFFNNRKYIVLHTDASSENAFEIFQTSAINFVSNMLLIRLDQVIKKSLLLMNDYDVEASFWTHRYTGTSNINEPYMLDKWFSYNQSFAFGRRLFFDKSRNLQGKTIKVGLFEYRPYFVIDKEAHKVSGVDFNMLKTITKYINATMVIYLDEGLWGAVLPNGTSYGLKGNLFNDSIDVGAAGLFMNELTRKEFDLTSVYVMAEITCLVPAPRLAAPWLSPYYSFSEGTWIGLIGTHLLLGVTIYLISYYENYLLKNRKYQSKLHLLQTTIAVIGKPMVAQPITNKNYEFKPILCIVMVATLTITAAFNAGFASVMTKPSYMDSIETLEQFLSSDIPWGTMQKAQWVYSWENDREETYRRAARRYQSKTEDELREISKKGEYFAFKMHRLSGRTSVDLYLKEDVIKYYRVMKENIHTQYATFILRKHSVLLPMFNKVVGILLQSGLVDYWIREYAGHEDYAIQKKIEALKSDTDREPVILKLQHVIGAFGLLLLGNTLALVIFFSEILLNIN